MPIQETELLSYHRYQRPIKTDAKNPFFDQRRGQFDGDVVLPIPPLPEPTAMMFATKPGKGLRPPAAFACGAYEIPFKSRRGRVQFALAPRGCFVRTPSSIMVAALFCPRLPFSCFPRRNPDACGLASIATKVRYADAPDAWCRRWCVPPTTLRPLSMAVRMPVLRVDFKISRSPN